MAKWPRPSRGLDSSLNTEMKIILKIYLFFSSRQNIDPCLRLREETSDGCQRVTCNCQMQSELQGKHRQQGKIHRAGSYSTLSCVSNSKALKEVEGERTNDRYFNGAQICTNYVKRSDRP